MFNLGKSNASPKIFLMTPEYARGVIQKSIDDWNAVIAVAETVLGEAGTSEKNKKRIAGFITDERSKSRVRAECLTLVGTESVACNVEELVEFNSAFPTSKPGLDARAALMKSLSDDDE
jgi:hypothetical protein